MTKDQLVVLVYKAFPYSNQIEELDTISEENAIRVTWRSQTFRIATDLFVEELVDKCMLTGNNMTTLVEKLLKRYGVQ